MKAGHNEELHGEEGQEILRLRRVAEAAQDVLESSHNERIPPPLHAPLHRLERALVEAGLRESLES